MKKLFCLGLMLASCLALSQPENPKLRKEVTARFHELTTLMNKEDMDGLRKMIAKEYVSVDLNGNRQNLAQAKEEWRQFFATFSDIKVKTDIKHVQGQGKEVVVWYEMSVSGKMKSSDELKPMAWSARFCETMRRSPSGLLFTYTQALPTNEPWSFNTGGG